MTRPDVDDVLLISRSARRQVPLVAAHAVVLCVYIALGAVGVLDSWIRWAGIAVLGTILLIGAVGLLRSRGTDWEVRLGPGGVTVRGHAEVPWSDVAEAG